MSCLTEVKSRSCGQLLTWLTCSARAAALWGLREYTETMLSPACLNTGTCTCMPLQAPASQAGSAGYIQAAARAGLVFARMRRASPAIPSRPILCPRLPP